MTKKIVVVGIAGAALIGGTAAYAYPPNVSMSATAVGTPDSTDGSDLAVTVRDSNPACDIRIDVNEVKYTVAAGHPTTFTETFEIKSERGRHTVQVKTVGCAGHDKEHAKAQFTLLKPHIDTKSSVKKNRSFTVTVKDFPANSQFSVVATYTGKGPAQQPQGAGGTTNSKGLGKVTLKLPATGDWGLHAVGGSQSATDTVHVK